MLSRRLYFTEGMSKLILLKVVREPREEQKIPQHIYQQIKPVATESTLLTKIISTNSVTDVSISSTFINKSLSRYNSLAVCIERNRMIVVSLIENVQNGGFLMPE